MYADELNIGSMEISMHDPVIFTEENVPAIEMHGPVSVLVDETSMPQSVEDFLHGS